MLELFFYPSFPPIELPSYSNNLSQSLICVRYRRIASPLEQNPAYIAENVDPPPPSTLNDSRPVSSELCVLSHWKRIFNRAIQPGPQKPRAFICRPVD